MTNNSVVDEGPSGSRRARWGEIRSKRKARRSVGARLLATAAAAAIAVTGLAVPMESASAATMGRGYDEPIGSLTAWNIGGVMTYCLEPTANDPLGASTSLGDRQWAGMSATNNARVNFAVTEYGQRASDNWAAATVLYVWAVADPQGYIDHTNGYASNQAQADLYYLERVPYSQRATVTSYLATIRAQAASVTAAPTGTGSVTMSLTADLVDSSLGELTISGMSPSSATGTITLTNGVFAGTGSNVMAGVTNGMVLDIIGTPADDVVDYKIRADGVFEAPSGYASQVEVFSHAAGQQHTAGPGPQARTSFTQWAEDPTDRTTIFQPVVGTQVSSKFVEIGEEFGDELTFGTAADENGMNNQWYTNSAGRYAPITATGTLYGPSLYEFVESDVAPANVPVAASGIEVTTTAEDGPNISYTALSGVVSNEPGYYTWVWEINQSDQPAASPNVQQFLPEDYNFTDRFGQVVETSITPSNVAISTELTAHEVAIGGTVTDNVTVRLTNGGWLSANGSRVPVTLEGTAYYSETEPVTANEAPADAEVIGTTELVVTSQGTTESEPITVPYKAGFITFQWCLAEENQPVEFQGMFNEDCDQWGLPSETAELVAPEVTTLAKLTATVADPIFDTAIVNGVIPENTVVEFQLFKKIEEGDFKYDGSGNPTTDTWTQDEVDALGEDAVCEATNLVTTTTGVAVTPGMNDYAEYVSPEVTVDSTGTYWWVERLIIETPEGDVVVHEGECGIANETTEVTEPSVMTKAVGSVELGEEAHDVAFVTGAIPGEDSGIVTELTFEAFEQVGDEAVCTADTRVFDLNDPIVVTGAGEYTSESVVFTKVGTYYWVETLTYVDSATGERTVVHVGECGLPEETTVVTPVPETEEPPTKLAWTGSDNSNAPLIIGGAATLLLLGLGLFAAAQIKRRRADAAAESVDA